MSLRFRRGFVTSSYETASRPRTQNCKLKLKVSKLRAKLTAMRVNPTIILATSNGYLIIDDCYNHR